MSGTERSQVLLVEDNPGDAILVQQSLLEAQGIGFEIEHVTRLGEALDAVERAENGPFDLVLLDLSLPDSFGADTFRRMSDATTAPIVIMTGFEDDQLGASLVQLGAQDYLVKSDVVGASFVRALRYAMERHRIEVELKEARHLALESMRAKGDFLSSMSHEIRTPLNSIIGMADLLQETQLSREQERYVEVFRNQGEMLLELLNSILDFSKVESGSLNLDETSFELGSMIDSTLEILAIAAHKKQLVLACDIRPGTPSRIVGDPVRLRQILVNLVGNAIKFTTQGEVVLTVEPDPKGRAPGWIRFSIADTGIGIPKEQQAKIFERFSQADNSVTKQYGGTGLGLSLSMELVHLMNGRLWVESEPGQGSTFRFDARFGIDELVETERPSTSFAGGRALIAASSGTERRILREQIEMRGFAVEEAGDTKDSISKILEARSSGCAFNLVLIDCRLPPEGGGFHVARMVQGEDCSERFVMMLNSDHRVGDVTQVDELDLCGWLVKPISSLQLHQVLSDLRQPKSEPRKTDVHDGPSHRRALRILVADDSEDNRSLLLAYLKNEAHDVTVVENGQLAVDLFKLESFDLVFMDMQMPVLDGCSATKAIRAYEQSEARTPTPILALTAYAFPEERKRSFDAGCNAHLTKPIRKRELLGAIEAYSQQETIVVEIDEDIADLVPGFLENRHGDVETLEIALRDRDFETMRRLGHNMKGVGRNYGFDAITEIGAALEQAAKENLLPEARKQVGLLEDYLGRVEIGSVQSS